MNSIDTRSPFFPNSKTARNELAKLKQSQLMERNSIERAQDLQERTKQDAKVSIPDKIKDFSRIKKAVDHSAPIDNSDKIAALKSQIQAGTYEPDYDAIAERMLQNEY